MKKFPKEVYIFIDEIKKSPNFKVEVKECPEWVLNCFKTAVEFGLLHEFCTTILNSQEESDLDKIAEACREWDL
jgi:hypothetical protein